MLSIMYDPSQDDRELISGFLAAYYRQAAPYIRLYSTSPCMCRVCAVHYMHVDIHVGVVVR